MRILHIVFNDVVDDPRVRRVVDSLYAWGHDVEVVGFQSSAIDRSARINQLPYKVALAQRPPARYFPARHLVAKLWREYLWIRNFEAVAPTGRFDVVHAHDLNALHFALLLARRDATPVIFDSHEIWTETGAFASWPKKWACQVYERALIRQCSGVITVTQYSADYIQNLYNIDPPVVITNCVQNLDASQRFPKCESHFEILYHGGLSGGRGCYELLHAVQLLPDLSRVRLRFRGSGPALSELRELSRSSARPSRVLFDDPLPMDALVRAATASHVGVVLTKDTCINNRFTISNKLFEYAMAGLPVLMSDLPEHRRLNEIYNFGLVLPNMRPQTIANALIVLEEDQSLYRKLSKGAVALSRVCNWESEFEKQLALYYECGAPAESVGR
jgi:glycosyltransferase involved in cell wall biosynthesis